MVTLRKRLMLAGGVATLALLALPSLVSANPGTGPEFVQRSGRLVVMHADRLDGSSSQRWVLENGSISCRCEHAGDVWVDPGSRVRLRGAPCRTGSSCSPTRSRAVEEERPLAARGRR